jgi:hypothetical protein
MPRVHRLAIVVPFIVALLVPAGAAPAELPETGQTRMFGIQEVPVILTAGQGRFQFRVRRNRVDWQLSYASVEGTVTQAHIHLGQTGVNGAIAVFLCSNLSNGPAGTQACPASPATIGGSFNETDVLAIAAQGLPAGGFARLVAALRAGATYANVHSTLFPGGEIRGQIKGSNQIRPQEDPPAD